MQPQKLTRDFCQSQGGVSESPNDTAGGLEERADKSASEEKGFPWEGAWNECAPQWP